MTFDGVAKIECHRQPAYALRAASRARRKAADPVDGSEAPGSGHLPDCASLFQSTRPLGRGPPEGVSGWGRPLLPAQSSLIVAPLPGMHQGI